MAIELTIIQLDYLKDNAIWIAPLAFWWVVTLVQIVNLAFRELFKLIFFRKKPKQIPLRELKTKEVEEEIEEVIEEPEKVEEYLDLTK